MIVGFIAKKLVGAAVTGAVGVALLEATKGTNLGNVAKQAAVGVTEIGIRGYKLVEEGAEKVWSTANEVFGEAKKNAEETDAAEAAKDAAEDAKRSEAEEEVVIAEVIVDDIKTV